MMLILMTDISTSERPAVSTALSKLATDGTINDFDYRRDGVYWIDATDISACGRAREHEVEQEIAAAIAKAITGALPRARLSISVTVEHDCTGCGHCCDTEETIWTSGVRASPEERAVFAIAMTEEATA